MTDKANTLEVLFSDSGPFDEAEVVRALRTHITIQRTTKKIYLKNSGLNTERKILAYGLAKKLLATKGELSSELITASEFFEATGIKKGTIDPSFKNLRERGFLVGKGEFEIPTDKIATVIELLNQEKAK